MFLYSGALTGMLSAMLPIKAKTFLSIVLQRNRTEPSPKPKFAPPECSLPGDAEVAVVHRHV